MSSSYFHYILFPRFVQEENYSRGPSPAGLPMMQFRHIRCHILSPRTIDEALSDVVEYQSPNILQKAVDMNR